MANRRASDPSNPQPTSTRGREADQSSVLFSLRELMDLEHERVSEEERQAEEARREQQRAKMEAELRIAAADEARRRAEAERRELQQASQREEKARLEALRLATIERARVEALEKARRDALELEHKHQSELVKSRGEQERSSLKTALVCVILAAAVLGGSGLTYYLGVVRPQAEAQRAELTRKTAQLEAEARAKKLDNDALAERQAQLQRDIEQLRTAPTVTAVPATPPAPVTAAPGPRPRPIQTVVPPPVDTRPCNPLDPTEERLHCK